MTIHSPLLLASASPRRRQLLSLLGWPYQMGISPVEEEALQERYRGPIEGLAPWLAEQKARGAHTLPEARGHLVITADTTVLLDGKVLGKPRDKDHAHELLFSLRNRWHHVVSGVAVSRLQDGELLLHSASCTTPVLMRPYSEEEVAAYIATGDPLDKAGAYGIQHPQFQPTERINGCYFNVVGLPLCTLVNLLARFDMYPRAQGLQGTACRWSERCMMQNEGSQAPSGGESLTGECLAPTRGESPTGKGLPPTRGATTFPSVGDNLPPTRGATTFPSVGDNLPPTRGATTFYSSQEV